MSFSFFLIPFYNNRLIPSNSRPPFNDLEQMSFIRKQYKPHRRLNQTEKTLAAMVARKQLYKMVTLIAFTCKFPKNAIGKHFLCSYHS